jgi:hypothetical protein
MLKSLVFSFLLILSSVASSQVDEKEFTIGSVEIVEAESNFSSPNQGPTNKNLVSELGAVIGVIDSLIAIGKKVYPIVEAGKPILSSELPVTHVLPKVNNRDVSDYDITLGMMENWKMPKSRSYRMIYKNLYGMEVISFTFTVHYQYGGSYNGSGKYLTGVFVSASNLYVSWGFEFSAKTKVIAITNHGTLDNPVAGLSLKLSWVAKSVITESQSSKVFHVTGNGLIK